jgi:protein-S-isoprenylcysteine O-methyltransferase Ste14
MKVTFNFNKSTEVAMLTPFLSLAALVLFLAVGIGVRVAHHLRSYGSSGVALRDPTTAALALAFPSLALVQAVYAFIEPERARSWLLFQSRPLAIAGFLIAVAFTLAMFVAQLDLGASWRIGIDAGARPGLVTSGLYRFSRNPIFAFMLLVIFGLALTQPTFLSFVLFKLAVVVVVVQVLREEAYLHDAYGAEYAAYTARVGRFFPRLL